MSLLLLALALSMDAFAAALSQGVAVSGPAMRRALITGFAFGAAQGLMPLLGWGLGQAFASVIRDYDHWVALVLLVLLGMHMIGEGFSDKHEAGDEHGSVASGTALLMMAIATSVDAAVAGITLDNLGYSVTLACLVIGITTFFISALGVFLGKSVGDAIGPRAQIVGGLVLIALGIRIVVEHVFFGA